jgi:hypothetical protein
MDIVKILLQQIPEPGEEAYPSSPQTDLRKLS